MAIQIATVYRVQDRTGRGPFRPGLTTQWAAPLGESLPTWMDEFGPVHLRIAPGFHAGCGCLTVEALRRWFSPEEMGRLRALGFGAVHMAASIIAASDLQCLFERPTPLRFAKPFDLYPLSVAVPAL